MSELLNAIRTKAGKTFKKVKADDGRTMYFKDGTPISSESWSAAHSHFDRVITTDNGEMPKNIKEANTAAELEQETGVPFTSNFFGKFEHTDKTQAQQAEANRFQGFWEANSHLSRDDAAKEYIKFRNELADVDTSEERAIIKDSYGLPGY